MGKCETCKRYEQMRFYGGDTWYGYCHQACGFVPCDGDGSFTDDKGGKKRCRRLYKPITTTTMERASDKLGAPHVTPAMWEQRRYEIARDAATKLLHLYWSNEFNPFRVSVLALLRDESYYQPEEAIIEEAVGLADALIEELKKPRK